MIDLRALHLTVLAHIRGLETGTGRDGFRRPAENTSGGVAGNVSPIVHTASAFNPTAHKAAHHEDCLSLGQHVREDDDALACLEPCQIRRPCGTTGGCGPKSPPRPAEIRSTRDQYRG